MSETTPLHEVTSKAGACFVEDAGWLVPGDFGDAAGEYRQAREHAALFDISARGKIELAGADALLFLHNLCTNDVKNLAAGASCEAFLCTAKARVVAHVMVTHFRQGEHAFVLLDFVPGMADKVLEHLDHFLISERVELADRTHDLAILHLCGPAAGAILDKAAIACDRRRHDPLGLPGFDILCRPENAAEVWRRLTEAGARPAGKRAWEILRIEAGTPAYGKDIDDDRLVMEVGRIQQAISYTKGCFLGQEPIVMARDRGHVNRILLGLKIAGGGPAASGARLFQEANEVGQVTSSVLSPRLGPIALAYLRRGVQDPGTRLEIEPESDGRQAMVSSLPFPEQA
jgi:folate-binding protein YgfZ